METPALMYVVYAQYIGPSFTYRFLSHDFPIQSKDRISWAVGTKEALEHLVHLGAKPIKQLPSEVREHPTIQIILPGSRPLDEFLGSSLRETETDLYNAGTHQGMKSLMFYLNSRISSFQSALPTAIEYLCRRYATWEAVLKSEQRTYLAIQEPDLRRELQRTLPIQDIGTLLDDELVKRKGKLEDFERSAILTYSADGFTENADRARRGVQAITLLEEDESGLTTPNSDENIRSVIRGSWDAVERATQHLARFRSIPGRHPVWDGVYVEQRVKELEEVRKQLWSKEKQHAPWEQAERLLAEQKTI